jgi:hypothetical protein
MVDVVLSDSVVVGCRGGLWGMSGLTCTGVGLVVVTAVGLAVKGMQTMQARQWGRCPPRPVVRTQSSSALGSPVTVAVVVPAHNEAATVEQTIRSCLSQTYPVAQVIVVADNCTDATAALARAVGATVIEGSGGSKAAAQNLALPYVVADLVVALDGDNTLDATAVAHMVATMRAGHAGTCAAVFPKDTTTIYSQYRTLYHALSNGWTKKIQDTLGRQLVLNGMANCHRTDVLATMGGFPDDSVTEDFNLTWALHRHGYPMGIHPRGGGLHPRTDLVSRTDRPDAPVDGGLRPVHGHPPSTTGGPRLLPGSGLPGGGCPGGGTGHPHIPSFCGPLRGERVLAVVGVAVDPHHGGEHRGGHQPTRAAHHPALSSGLVSPPDPHRSGHHLVAG